MPAILPTPLPAVVGIGTVASTAVPSAPWDVVIGGFGFMLNNDPNTPFIRTGADYRSPYVNYSGAPGEQALGFWWPRTQYAWQGGAGNPTFDGLGSGDPNIALTRYDDSVGVDPFTTLGQFSLLPDTNLSVAVGSSPTELVNVVDGSLGNILVWGDGSNIKYWNGSTSGNYAAATTALTLCADGVSVYAVVGSTVQRFGSSPGTAYTGLSGTNFLLRYAKQRLILAENNVLYELANPAGTGQALPAQLFTHPNPNWVWTDITAGPGAIYACGFAGTQSAVYMFLLNTSTGALPVLSGGTVACELPDGESANAMLTYLDLFMGICTSRGVRVCAFNSDNSIILASLTMNGLGASRAICGWDRFLYVSCDNADVTPTAGLVRIDPSYPVDTNRYAYSRDLRANSAPSAYTGVVGATSAVCMYKGTPAFLVPGSGLFTQDATRLALAGFLQASKMLFGMTDYKIFQRGSWTMEGEGEVTLSTFADSTTGLVSRATGNAAVDNRIETNLGSQRGSALSVRFDLDRQTTTTGPIITGYSMRALPSQAREDAYTIPLRCYDRVENRYGETVFQNALDSVEGIAEIVRFQTPVILQTFIGEAPSSDNTQGDWRTVLVQVETYEFKQATAEDGWGGTLTLSIRTITGE